VLSAEFGAKYEERRERHRRIGSSVVEESSSIVGVEDFYVGTHIT